MARHATVKIPDPERGRWIGIDRRNTQTGADPSTLYDALNVDLTIGGKLRARDALEEFAILPPGTHGLYSLGGFLRVAGPAGNGLAAMMPSPSLILLDQFGDSDAAPTPLGAYTKLRSVSNWGSSFETGPQPYLLLETAGGQILHHWCNQRPPGLYDPLDTIISTPFASGPDIVKLHGKFWAVDRYTGYVHYCATYPGPVGFSDVGVEWRESVAPADAGFISPIAHSFSEPGVRGLGQHQGNLMVVYDNAIQLWQASPNPADIRFLTAYNGPGTKQFGTLTNVIGDVFYFSDGGFRSLATQTVTGELREGDLGAPIEELTRPFNNISNSRAYAVWSQARSQYICFFNNEDGTCTVFPFTSLPSIGVMGWTRWELDITVDFVVEHEDALYIRSGDTVYRLNPAMDKDYFGGDPYPIEVDVITQFLTAGADRKPKQWLTLDVNQVGACDVSILIDQKNRSIEEPVAYNLDGATYDIGAIPIQAFGHSVALRFKTTKRWTLDGASLDLLLLDGMG